MKDFQARLGFDTSLPVKKGSFVCRLMKLGVGITDRYVDLTDNRSLLYSRIGDYGLLRNGIDY